MPFLDGNQDVCVFRHLLARLQTAVLQQDDVTQETLLNLLLRNYLHYHLYDQVPIFSTELVDSVAVHRLKSCDRRFQNRV